ncbi:hypothetical protein GGX14DRAFT_588806 [Mycena pura]|uniref:Uncharacterized protein n=1 Tax=Mycena pura TaxID=153505 RepID=A0AAD6Y472_9AGAR|nr:hypothetical protein GGX14DRAFT_588806 [Mycena pura]
MPILPIRRRGLKWNTDVLVNVSGRIPLSLTPSQLVLFFRSKNGTSHALDSPIDIAYHTSPGFEGAVLEVYSTLVLTPSLEIANYPILDAIRTALFPALPQAVGQFSPCSDRVDVLAAVATLNITLPVRFHGGALTIRDADGRTERLGASAAPTAHLERAAFLDCLARPFLDLLPPVLQMSRRRKVAFFPSHRLRRRPFADVGALSPPSLHPSHKPAQLKGGDALLYAALKVYKFAPVLHSLYWSGGGNPVDLGSSMEFPYHRDLDLSLCPTIGPSKRPEAIDWTVVLNLSRNRSGVINGSAEQWLSVLKVILIIEYPFIPLLQARPPPRLACRVRAVQCLSTSDRSPPYRPRVSALSSQESSTSHSAAAYYCDGRSLLRILLQVYRTFSSYYSFHLHQDFAKISFDAFILAV